MDFVVFDMALYQSLVRAYNLAVKHGRDQFEFEGRVVLTSYAKYLIEYLNQFFPKPGQVH